MEGSGTRQLKKVDIPRYRVERLEQLCAVMPPEVHSDFERSYGRILDLLKICVDPIFVRVLIHFWSSDLHCFEFPQFDLVPTLEEYELMLQLPKSAGVYLSREARISVSKVAALIRLPDHQSALVGKGSIQGWKIAMLEDHLAALAAKEDWSAFNKTLALVVFGTFLFPFHTDSVDHAAMDAFFAWDVHSKSPVPALLADTLLSIEFCHHKQGKTLRCCSTLLYVWAMTHFYASSHMGASPDPLRSFSKIPLRRRYASEWKAELEHWSIDHLSWVCPWFRPGYILIRCGDYPSVPLLGLRGCIAYSPSIAMRQLMRTQIIPSKEGLGGLCFLGDPCSFEGASAIRRAWESPVYIGDRELGKPRMAVSNDFEEWRRSRGVPQPSAPPASSSARDELRSQVDALTKRVEDLGVQMRTLEEKDRESTLLIDGLQRQCKKKDQEIERLKNRCADFEEQAARPSKMPRIDTGSQLQEMNAKIAHLEAKYSSQAQTIRRMYDDLAMARSEAHKWREAAHHHSASLSELHKKEKIGLAQIGQISRERDQAVEKAGDLQSLIVYHEAKTKEAQRCCEAMSQAVHQQAEALARHVREAEDELHRNLNPPVGFFRLFRFCQSVLRSIV